MNPESIHAHTRHVTDVLSIETQIASLTDQEKQALINERRSLYSIRWAQCNRSFRMLFMTLNRGNRWPSDSFTITLRQESFNGITVETCVRVWRDRKSETFNIKPFTRQGTVENHEFSAEVFSSIYEYTYGTHHSKKAKLIVDTDGPEPLIDLQRIDGQLVDNPIRYASVYLSALDNHIAPAIENTEDSLIMIHQAVLDERLNPNLALSARSGHPML